MDEEKSRSGCCCRVTGGRWSLLTLQLMAEQGQAWPLIEGTGTIYGMFVIESISKHSEFSPTAARAAQSSRST